MKTDSVGAALSLLLVILYRKTLIKTRKWLFVQNDVDRMTIVYSLRKSLLVNGHYAELPRTHELHSLDVLM